MARADYSLWLNTPTGTHIAALPQPVALEAARAVNDTGEMTLTLPASIPFSWLSVDRQIEIWRRPAGYAPSLLMETVWLMRRWSQRRESGQLLYEITAVPAFDLLNRRIVYAPTGSAGAAKSGAADNIMKAYVREAMGASVIDSSRSIASYLSVAADTTQGPTISVEAAYQPLGDVLRDAARMASAGGAPVYFDLTAVTGGAFAFQTYTGQRGVDRSSESSAAVVVSEEAGSLVDPSYTEDYTGEITYVYAGGVGEGAARIIGTAPSSSSSEYARQLASPFNRREAWTNAGGYTTTTACAYAAESVLRAGRPRRIFAGTLTDTEQARYGVHWQWGDKVSAVFAGVQADCVIATIDVQLRDGRESITASLVDTR